MSNNTVLPSIISDFYIASKDPITVMQQIIFTSKQNGIN